MDLNFKQHLPGDFNDSSRVWIYQGSRMFLISEALEIEEMLQEFVQNWHSHGVAVKGYANLFFGRFLVFMADETASGVSGCSTDSSVRLVKAIENNFKVDMFNRQSLGFIVKDKIEQLPLSQLSYAFENKFLNEETIYFNNTVLTKKQLVDQWLIPIKDSWLMKQLGLMQ
ncbi:MAG: hypothetical protein ABI741_11840 [Ferruginibacter sp.]